MGKVSRLADPEFARLVAEAYADGLDRPTMAGMFDCHVDTISDWTNDPRVTVHIQETVKQRVHRLSRRIDKELEARVQDPNQLKKMDTEVLLKLRKELLGPHQVRGQKDSDGESAGDIWEILDKHPELADQLNKALTKDDTREGRKKNG